MKTNTEKLKEYLTSQKKVIDDRRNIIRTYTPYDNYIEDAAYLEGRSNAFQEVMNFLYGLELEN